MRKLNCKISIATFSLLCFSIHPLFASSIRATAFEEHVELILSEVNEFKTRSAPASNEIIPLVPNPSIFVKWGATWDDLYKDWGVELQLLEHTLTIKLGFMSGTYDSYTQTYKAQPVVYVTHRYSGGFTMTNYLVSGAAQHFTWTNPAGTLDINAVFDGKTVTVSDYANASNKVQVTYLVLLEKWREYAETGNYFHYLGNKYYIVPQSTWQGDGFHFGYVISGNSPQYYTTGFPQGYVELYKESGNATTYLPVAYSLATRLAFVLSPTQKKTWEVRQMTAEEVGEAMVNRTNNHTPSSGSSASGTSWVNQRRE